MAGGHYGLAFNWGKLEVLTVGCQTQILRLDGQPVQQKDTMIYLGGMISSSGDSGTELNRRLGMARKDFDVLCRI